MKATLLLKDGTTFHGEAFGAETTAIGEVVFNTGMTGYQEIITDPSYKGQMVTMTYPHIGNYGINSEDVESKGPQVEGFIVKEFCPRPSNYRSEMSLSDYLKKNKIPGIHQIDTRKLTKHIREAGAMMGILCTEGTDIETLKQKLQDHPPIEGRDLVQYVTTDKTGPWTEPVKDHWYYQDIKPVSNVKIKIAALDFGIKQNILRLMTAFGMDVTVFSARTTADQIREFNPDGIFLSNGPGDPSAVKYAIETVKTLIGYKPVFGICLGHQILGLAFGADTYKLKFGHHGSNHPVMNLATREIEITAQNHNYAHDPKALEKAGFEVTHLNLNDKTVEGMRHKEFPVFSVQHHPEASPGPHDAIYLFKEFHSLINKS